jgi:hypothetical protein
MTGIKKTVERIVIARGDLDAAAKSLVVEALVSAFSLSKQRDGSAEIYDLKVSVELRAREGQDGQG